MVVIPAKKESTCPSCRTKVHLGDPVTPHESGPWQHASCATGIDLPTHWEAKRAAEEDDPPRYRQSKIRKTPMCSDCFTEHNGECM